MECVVRQCAISVDDKVHMYICTYMPVCVEELLKNGHSMCSDTCIPIESSILKVSELKNGDIGMVTKLQRRDSRRCMHTIVKLSKPLR